MPSEFAHSWEIFTRFRNTQSTPRIRWRASRRVQSMVVGSSRTCRARPLASRRVRNASCARARAAYAVRGCAVARTDEVLSCSSLLRSREDFVDSYARFRRVRERVKSSFDRRRKWERQRGTDFLARRRTSQDVLRPDESGVYLDGQEARERQRGDTRYAETHLAGGRDQRGSREKEQYQVRMFSAVRVLP